MKIGTMFITAGVVALGLAAWITPSKAQGPMYDRVNVNLPYSVTVGDRTLPPGDYVIQQLRDQAGNSRVLLIYSDNGMKFETSAMTIPALDPNTPENTRVILHHFGNDYYFDKIWIQGKDYGYEFPVPDSVKARQNERMEPVSVAATYSTTQSNEVTNNTTTTQSATTTTQTTTPAANNNATTATNNATTTTPANQATTATNNAGTMTVQNQNQTTTQPSTVPSTTQNTTTAQNTMPPSTNNSYNDNSNNNNENTGAANRSMPNTSAGWLMMLLSGGALSSAGLALRKR